MKKRKGNGNQLLFMIGVFFLVFVIWNLTFLTGWIFHIDTGGDDSFFSVFQQLVYGRIMQVDTNWTASMFGISESIVFSILFGTYLYRQADIRGVYYFVRQPSRKGWLFKSSLHLFFISCLWGLLQVGVPYILASIYCRMPVSVRTFALFFLVFVSISVFNFFITYGVNLLSMKIGSVFSFIAVYVLLLLSFIVSSSIEHWYPAAYFLPTEITIVNWTEELKSLGDFWRLNRDTLISLSVLLIYCLAMIAAALLRVDRWDIGLKDRENV